MQDSCKAFGVTPSCLSTSLEQEDSVATCVADQWVTAYFANASSAVHAKLASQQFRHLAYYEDASKVGTREVSFHLFRDCESSVICEARLERYN